MSANTSFQMVNEQGWRRGFANLLRHENSNWWRTRRWWINTLIWLVLINGGLLGMLSSANEGSGAFIPREQVYAQALSILAILAGMFAPIGAVIAVQGSVIDEKKSGTAAWIASKPVARAAFILAKMLANVIALLVVIIVIQGVVAYVQLSNFLGSLVPVGPFVAGLALLSLNLLFYLTLTLMLGTLFNDRGPVIGIPIGILFSASFLMSYLGDAVNLMPWLLVPSGSAQGLSVEAMMEQPVSNTTPILATIVWIVIFVAVALRRYEREEF